MLCFLIWSLDGAGIPALQFSLEDSMAQPEAFGRSLDWALSFVYSVYMV